MYSDYLFLAFLGAAFGSFFTRIKFLKRSVAYSITVFVAALCVLQLVSARLGYYDPFFPVFIVVSSPVPLLSCWIADSAWASVVNKNHFLTELKEKSNDLIKAIKYIFLLVLAVFIFTVPIALISAYA